MYISVCCLLVMDYVQGSKSYVEVYEQAVVGITKINPKRPTDTMQNFETGYDEIINVSRTNKGIQIYTSYTVFEVAAMKNRGQAVQEIRSRMKGKQ